MTNGHYTIVLVLFLSTLTWRFASVAGMGVIGRTETCDNEGEQVHLDHLDKQKCYFCICRNGYVECERNPSCPEIKGCHMIIEKTPDHCCAKCKGCYFNGTYYENGEEWIAKDAPCTSYQCQAGVVTQSRVHCHLSCDNPEPPEPGKCCPTCPDCRINGYMATDDRAVTTGDLCVKCRCFGGSMTCLKKACPVLQCAPIEQIRNAGECCPTCKGNRSAHLEVPQYCTLASRFYPEGSTISTDNCTTCTCSTNQTSVCVRENCPPLDCSPRLQRKRPNNCCKECIAPEDDGTISEVQSRCNFNGRTYEEGQKWSLDACTTCICKGKILCMKTPCNDSVSCPIGSHLVHEKGECCKKCVENKLESTCVVFGDSHYRTFDGKMYRFQGLGKYQFASDCHNHTFSVRITNELRNRSKSSTMTKRARIKFTDARINLGQHCRVTLNGRRLSHSLQQGNIEIIKDVYDVKVVLDGSIKILWNCHSYLEITTPISYKNKLCGLCGNFNFNVQDDFKVRKGGIASDAQLMKFGFSWCVGKECPRSIGRTHQLRQCKPKPKTNAVPCRILTASELFSKCHKKLSYNKYYSACVQDMCDCPNGNCYCESLTAYAEECKRLGIKIDNWQSDYFCAGNSTATNVIQPQIARKPHKHSVDNYSTFDRDDVDMDVRRLSNISRKKSTKGPALLLN